MAHENQKLFPVFLDETVHNSLKHYAIDSKRTLQELLEPLTREYIESIKLFENEIKKQKESQNH